MADIFDANVTEQRLHERILKFEADAESAMDVATRLQTDFAQRLMLAAGAALGVLSTLIATEASWLSPIQFIGPMGLLIASLVLSGIGLWARTIALFKQVHYLLAQGRAYSFMKQAVEDQARRGVVGTEPTPSKPRVRDFSEWWFSALDYFVIASGIAFISGLIWAGLEIVFGSPHH